MLEHLPDSAAATLASYIKEPNLQTATEAFQWVEKQQPDNAESLRYAIWTEQDPDDYVSLLTSCSKPQEHLECLSEIYDYDGLISDADMIQLCKIILEADPKNREALNFLGDALSYAGKHKQAAEKLQQARDALDDSPSSVNHLNEMILQSLYHSGDRKAAMESATSPELIVSLLRIKHAEDDYDDFEALIKRLEVDSDARQEYQALWDFHQGNFTAAANSFAKLIKQANSDDESPGRDHLYRRRLFDLCRKQNDVAKAFQIAPSDEMLSMVVTELIDQSEWEPCEKLLNATSTTISNQQRLLMRSQLLWAQEMYQALVDLAPDNDAWATHEDAGMVLDRITRSALRLKQPDKAMRFARLIAEHHHWDDLVLLVALHQNNQSLALKQLKSMPEWDRDSVYRERDLRGLAWRDVIPADSRPRRQLYTGYSDFGGPIVRLLFQTQSKIDSVALGTKLENALGKPLQTTRLDSANPNQPTWVMQSQDWQLQITQAPFRMNADDLSSADEPLQGILANAKSKLPLELQAMRPTTTRARKQAMSNVLKAFSSDRLLTVDQYSSFLTAAELKRYHELPSEQQAKTSLFASGPFEGVPVDLEIETPPQEQDADRALQTKFIAAYKQLNEEPNSATLIVQIHVGRDQNESIEAQVDAVKRRGRDVQLQATLLSDSVTVPSFQQGDPVWLNIQQIKQFRLNPKAR